MAFYIESADRPPQSRVAGSDVHVGEAVAPTGSDTVRPFDGSQDALGDFLGVADDPLTSDAIARDEDDTNFGVYLASENDRVIYNGDADGDLVKIRTAEDTGGNEAAPSISDGDVVGFIDTSAGTLSSASEYHGRIVQEGYTDGESTPTTYNRSNGNFVAIGRAYRKETADFADGWDVPIRVEINKSL